MQQLVLGHVNQIRKAGVRGTQTIIGAKLGTLDNKDKEAGKKLFAMLARMSLSNRYLDQHTRNRSQPS